MKAVAGVLGKLEYVAGLRHAKGRYEHWGLARTHGEVQAQQALAETHRSLLARVLRTPLRYLVEDIEVSSQSKGVPPASYLEDLKGGHSDLLPSEPGAGSARHFSSVLHALLSLIKSRRGAIPPAS